MIDAFSPAACASLPAAWPRADARTTRFRRVAAPEYGRLDDHCFRERAQLRLFSVREVPGAVYDNGSGNARGLFDVLDQLKGGHIWQVEIEHHAVELLFFQGD